MRPETGDHYRLKTILSPVRHVPQTAPENQISKWESDRPSLRAARPGEESPGSTGQNAG
ncbi:hypothetical protein KM92DES2_10094 [uncultured Desulfovibrio sp.]|uniref:Uncharacterized protein n=1 Tax=uncultured Desulfovibrio sp. TaxID=167968 RepID=A0A212IVC7_9BACT|nr:hypothetical protein KM92DES2_10094 [uncultured Desulfovibrio sp.]